MASISRYCPKTWNGFSPIEGSAANALGYKLKVYVNNNLCSMEDFLKNEPEIVFKSDPETIIEVLSNVQPCPIHTLPKSIQSWINAIADQMQVPLDYLTAPFLVYVGTVIGRKRGLLLRPNTNWFEHPNLWGMIIGRPSIMKSPPMKAVQGPLLKLARRAKDEYRIKVEKYNEELKFWKMQEKAQSKIYQTLIQESLNDNNNFDHSSNSAPQIAKEPLEPKCKRYKTQDATVEKIGELIKDNPQGILIYRDEINGWFNSLKKKGREADRAFYMEGHSGKEGWDVDRIGRGSLDVPPMSFSIFGSIQPGPISRYVYDSLKGGIDDDGFLQRFQIVVWPDPLNDWKLVPSSPMEPLEQTVFEIFEFLDSLEFDDQQKPIIIPFSSDAQLLFDEWQGDWEAKIRKGNLPEHLESHLGKYKKLIAALVLIFEHLHTSVEADFPIGVSKISLEAAIIWIDYFESHAIRLYNCGLNKVSKAAKDLLRKIKEGKLKLPFSARDVYYGNHWSGLSNAEQVNEVLNFLLEKAFLSPIQIQNSGGRSTTKYWVHPKFDKFL